jgi:hypothetical protein
MCTHRQTFGIYLHNYSIVQECEQIMNVHVHTHTHTQYVYRVAYRGGGALGFPPSSLSFPPPEFHNYALFSRFLRDLEALRLSLCSGFYIYIEPSVFQITYKPPKQCLSIMRLVWWCIYYYSLPLFTFDSLDL